MSAVSAEASKQRRGLLAILLSTFANYLTITILTIALRPITIAFGADVDDAAWVQLAPALVSGLLTPAAGKLADDLGRLLVFRLGVVFTSLGTLGCALAPTLAALVGARVLTGIGTALAMPSGLALASALYPPEQRSIPVGYWTSITAFAPALGVLVGGAVVEQLSWRYLFVGQLPFSALSLLLTVGSLEESRTETRGRFDALGALLFGSAVFALTLASNRGNDWGWTSPAVLFLFAVTFVFFAFFLAVEKRVETPVLPLALLGDPVVVWATAARSLMYAVHMGSFIVLPLFLMDIAGRTPGEVALALMPRPIAMGFAAPLVPLLGERFGRTRTTVAGALLMLLGVSTMPFLGPDSSYGFLLVGLVCMGTGLGVSQTMTASEVAARAPLDDLGATSALLSISTAVSGTVGTAVLLALATREGAPSADAYQSSFVASALLSGVALLTAFRFAAVRRSQAA